jgi:DNA mismatch repair ATPase MutL
MKEISLHILDIGMNSVRAEAENLTISIKEDKSQDKLFIEVIDDGHGIDKDDIQKVLDPFYTSKNKKKVGLGVPLFKFTCEQCEGELTLDSKLKEGTELKCYLQLSHIDRPEIGNIASVIAMLMVSHPEVNTKFIYAVDENKFEVSSEELKKSLELKSLGHAELSPMIEQYISNNVEDLKPDN